LQSIVLKFECSIKMYKKNITYSLFIGCISIFGFFIFKNWTSRKGHETKIAKIQQLPKSEPRLEVKTVLISELSQNQIRLISRTNPCYLPLLRDSTFYPKGSRVGFHYSELYNSHLGQNHPYANRYIVGDFNTLNDEMKSRGVKEFYPSIENLRDFDQVSEKVKEFLSNYDPKSEKNSQIDLKIDSSDFAQLEALNFYNQVWKFYSEPIESAVNHIGNQSFASGQSVCLCEAHEDTLQLIARFAVSSKRLDIKLTTAPDGTVERTHFQLLPIGNFRHYYAPLYHISSRNWETQRDYNELDSLHDLKLGAINHEVTFYRGRTELPNFLLMKPDSAYTKAMHGNGIHEVALRELSRGMLGSPNSIGCIRVSDFGSKFCRWWTPQQANFFILYQPDRYFSTLEN